MEQTFMKEKKILPLVLSMSLPMVISMAVNSLYNIVDSYFVAKLNEEAMTADLPSGSTRPWLIIWALETRNRRTRRPPRGCS